MIHVTIVSGSILRSSREATTLERHARLKKIIQTALIVPSNYFSATFFVTTCCMVLESCPDPPAQRPQKIQTPEPQALSNSTKNMAKDDTHVLLSRPSVTSVRTARRSTVPPRLLHLLVRQAHRMIPHQSCQCHPSLRASPLKKRHPENRKHTVQKNSASFYIPPPCHPLSAPPLQLRWFERTRTPAISTNVRKAENLGGVGGGQATPPPPPLPHPPCPSSGFSIASLPALARVAGSGPTS